MDRAQAESTALAAVNQHRGGNPEDELVVVPGSTAAKPYGWVMFVQSRRYLETGDISFAAVGSGPVVVLDDGSVHTLGSAHPPDEELQAFEVARGLYDPTAEVRVPGSADGPPVWVGAEGAGGHHVICLTPAGVVSAWLDRAAIDDLLRQGPGVLDRIGHTTTVPIGDIDRIRTDGDTRLRIERRGDIDVVVRFATAAHRDDAFHGLHRLVAPHQPVELLRRPTRQFVEPLGLALLVLGIGFGLPWMVETGQLDRTQWLIATIFNAVGPTGFRLIGVGLAVALLAWLTVRVVDNPSRTGFRVR